MASTPPLWTGRQAGDDHGWLAQPAPRPPSPRQDEPPPPPPPPRRWNRWLLGAVAAAVIAIAVGVGTLIGNDSVPKADAPLTVQGGRPPATRINAIYDAAARGVVSVQVARGAGAASGTGFVVGADGTIVTNAHVIDQARTAQVRFNDQGQPIEAKVVGIDPSSDLAVLRVDPRRAPRLHPLVLANSDQVRVGDTAVAIGYPLGLDRTATAGIISGLGREISAPNGFRIDKVLQTDAPINPGNSGGPLLDAKARVVGVNSQIATAGGSQGSVGIGFAVPSNTVRQVVPKLERGQRIDRPWLGVSTSPALGVRGAVVRDVTGGGPAAKAGLQPSQAPDGSGGDIIVGVDGRAVAAPDDVAKAIDGHKPGDVVQVQVIRDGTRQTVDVTLGRRPDRIP
jgi:putative serine protease PepD